MRTGEAQALLTCLATSDGSPPAQPERAQKSGKGSLIVVGTGIRSVGQLTVEAIAHIKSAERVFFLVARASRPGGHLPAESGGRRIPRRSLRGGKAAARDVSRDGRPHPGQRAGRAPDVCGLLWSSRRLRRPRPPGDQGRPGGGLRCPNAPWYFGRGLPVCGPSASIRATAGCQSYEATEFLVNRRQADPTSHLILWQVGVPRGAELQPRGRGLELPGLAGPPPRRSLSAAPRAAAFSGVSPPRLRAGDLLDAARRVSGRATSPLSPRSTFPQPRLLASTRDSTRPSAEPR